MSNRIVFSNDTFHSNFFKNRIINGDFSVAQRGKTHSIYNTGKYTLDRVFTISTGYYLSHKQDKIYAPDEGSLTNTLDIFGDGSCIATYTLDGNANDLSGKYNGTWSGNEAYDVGRFGQAAKFDGNSYVEFQNTTNLDTTKSFTISVWGKLIETNDSYGRFFDKYYYGTSKSADKHGIIICSVPDDSKVIFEYGEGSTNCIQYLDSIEINVWYHFAVSFDGNVITFYIDGEKVYSAAVSTPTNADKNATIGSGHDHTDDSHTQPLIGAVDQVRIFNRSLTGDEVKILYTESNNYKESPIYFLVSRIENEDTSDTKYIVPYVYRFEGQHLYDLAVEGKKVTLSFEFAAPKDGTYSFSFRNKTNGIVDSYVKSFEYTGGGEFQKFEFTIDLSEFPKRFNNDEHIGFDIIIGSSDPNYKAPSEGLFTNSDYHFVDGTNNYEVGDWIRLRKVQLEEGDKATEFEYVPYDIQLLRCMRYYYKFDYRELGNGIYFLKYVDSDKGYFAPIYFKTRMRIKPTVVKCEISSDATNITFASMPYYVSRDCIQILTTSSDGNPVTTSAAVLHLEADAEF